ESNTGTGSTDLFSDETDEIRRSSTQQLQHQQLQLQLQEQQEQQQQLQELEQHQQQQLLLQQQEQLQQWRQVHQEEDVEQWRQEQEQVLRQEHRQQELLLQKQQEKQKQPPHEQQHEQQQQQKRQNELLRQQQQPQQQEQQVQAQQEQKQKLAVEQSGQAEQIRAHQVRMGERNPVARGKAAEAAAAAAGYGGGRQGPVEKEPGAQGSSRRDAQTKQGGGVARREQVARAQAEPEEGRKGGGRGGGGRAMAKGGEEKGEEVRRGVRRGGERGRVGEGNKAVREACEAVASRRLSVDDAVGSGGVQQAGDAGRDEDEHAKGVAHEAQQLGMAGGQAMGVKNDGAAGAAAADDDVRAASGCGDCVMERGMGDPNEGIQPCEADARARQPSPHLELSLMPPLTRRLLPPPFLPPPPPMPPAINTSAALACSTSFNPSLLACSPFTGAPLLSSAAPVNALFGPSAPALKASLLACSINLSSLAATTTPP
ncbi:unnamed protein product, partial [Closterium sp. NIES-53]